MRYMIIAVIQHVHVEELVLIAASHIIGASLSEPHIVVISITFSCTSYRRYYVCRRSDSV